MSSESWELMRKSRGNEATRLRRKAKKNYWKEVSKELGNNSRKFFNTFTPLLRATSENRPEIMLEIQGKLQQDRLKLVVADELKNMFRQLQMT